MAIWTMEGTTKQGGCWSQKQFPLGAELQILTSLKTNEQAQRSGQFYSPDWRNWKLPLWGVPPGERFHCGNWDGAFVVTVGDSSQMPALQRVCSSLSFICVCLKYLVLTTSNKSHIFVKCSFLNCNYLRLSRVDSDGERVCFYKTPSVIYQLLSSEDFFNSKLVVGLFSVCFK